MSNGPLSVTSSIFRMRLSHPAQVPTLSAAERALPERVPAQIQPLATVRGSMTMVCQLVPGLTTMPLLWGLWVELAGPGMKNRPGVPVLSLLAPTGPAFRLLGEVRQLMETRMRGLGPPPTR